MPDRTAQVVTTSHIYHKYACTVCRSEFAPRLNQRQASRCACLMVSSTYALNQAARFTPVETARPPVMPARNPLSPNCTSSAQKGAPACGRSPYRSSAPGSGFVRSCRTFAAAGAKPGSRRIESRRPVWDSATCLLVGLAWFLKSGGKMPPLPFVQVTCITG